jgi:hypothetical protein
MYRKELFLIMGTRGNDDHKDRVGKNWEDCAPSTRMRWRIILGVLIFVATIIGGGYAYEQSMVRSALKLQTQSRHSLPNPSPTLSSYSISTPP